MKELGFSQDITTKVRNIVYCRFTRPKWADADDPSSISTTSTLLIQTYRLKIATKPSRNFTSRGASIGCVEPITGTRGAYSTLPAKSTDYGTNAPPPVALTNTLTNCRVKCRRLQNADSRVVNLHVPAMGTEGRHVHFLYPFDCKSPWVASTLLL